MLSSWYIRGMLASGIAWGRAPHASLVVVCKFFLPVQFCRCCWLFSATFCYLYVLFLSWLCCCEFWALGSLSYWMAGWSLFVSAVSTVDCLLMLYLSSSFVCLYAALLLVKCALGLLAACPTGPVKLLSCVFPSGYVSVCLLLFVDDAMLGCQ